MAKTKTSANTWQASLTLLLRQLISESGRLPRIAIVGVGNPFRSDDAAGILIVRGLSRQAFASDADHFLIFEAGHAPENVTGELHRFGPDLILFIDAAEMGQKAGTVQWVPEDCMDGMSASTHSLPLSMLARYLRLELGCKVILLGVQPACNEVGETLSTKVLQAVEEVVEGIVSAIHACASLGTSNSQNS